MNRKKIIIVLAAAVAVSALCLVWQRWFAATEVAFVNWQVSDLGQISKANDNGFVKIRELPVSRLSEAGRYDMVFVNGMGIRITAEQREGLRRVIGQGQLPAARPGPGQGALDPPQAPPQPGRPEEVIWC